MALATTLTLNVEWSKVPGFVYKTIPFTIYGTLKETASGNPISAKTITVTYNGSGFGSDITNASGEWRIEGQDIDDTPGSYTLTAAFAGDATYDPSQDTEPFTLSKIPTVITLITPASHPEDQYAIAQGTLTNDVTNEAIQGETVTIKKGAATVGSDTTDIEGYYAVGISTDDTPAFYSITAEFVETSLYLGDSIANTMEIVIHKYPAPEDVETDCYAWALCIDPKAIRSGGGGPIYYILDSAQLMPGLTDRSGSFRGTLNDNASEEKPGQWDMYLLQDDASFILDQDEFWIGLQRGPVNKEAFPVDDTWNPSGGVDGEGAGRKWIMGGYICKRSYKYDKTTRITLVLMGKDYMDVWRDQPIGIAEAPRNYEEPTRLDQIAVDILTDVNNLQDDEYEYTGHPDYFPTFSYLRLNVSYLDTAVAVESTDGFTTGSALIWDDDQHAGEVVTISAVQPAFLQLIVTPISNINGYQVSNRARIMMLNITDEWEKEIKQEAAFDLMQDIAEEIGYEWGIDFRRRVMLYPRTSPPEPTDVHIRYENVIQEIPEIMLGDTSEIITHVIVTDGEGLTHPRDVDTWCLTEGVWQDVRGELRVYTAATNPPPPNAVTGAYADATLIWDDEGHPALCFQYQSPTPTGIAQFILHLTYYVDGTLTEVGAKMNLDLRKWRRLIYKWKHASRPANWAALKPTAYYRVYLHTSINDFYWFEFGEGTQEDDGYSLYDTVIGRDWNRIDLLLPEPDEDGILRDDKGWNTVGNPDLTEINWIHFTAQLPETDPGYAPGQLVSPNPSAGDRYITVSAPERFAGLDTGFTGERKLFSPPLCRLGTENCEIDAINPGEAPLGENIRLRWPLNNAHTNDQLRLRGGRIISFSQVHFERIINYEEEAVTKVGPNRYRLAQTEELEYLKEIEGKAVQALGQEGLPRKWVKVLIDGDPEKMIGYKVRVYLDPVHHGIFQSVPMIIDDIDYELESVTLEQELTLGLMNETAKPRELNEFTALDSAGRLLKNIGTRRTRVDVPR